MVTSLKSIQMQKLEKWLRMLQNIHTSKDQYLPFTSEQISHCHNAHSPWLFPEWSSVSSISVSWILAASSSHFWASDYPPQCSLMWNACALCPKPVSHLDLNGIKKKLECIYSNSKTFQHFPSVVPGRATDSRAKFRATVCLSTLQKEPSARCWEAGTRHFAFQ